jgi:hypothetical protein
VAEPVLVKVMVCCVAVGPGTFEKISAVGLRARPESGLPKPVSCAVTGVVEVEMVRVPVSGPVDVGLKIRLRKQEALGVSWPVQAGPPVGKAVGSARAKLPVVVGELRATVSAVRLVRVKRVGALVLWTGTGPKSWLIGVRMRPVSGRPVPVRVRGDGVPEEVDYRVSVAVCEPVVEGVN